MTHCSTSLGKVLLCVLVFYDQSVCGAAESDHTIFGQPNCDGQILQRSAYVLCYDKSTKNASWTSYHLKATYLVKNASKRDNFRPDPDLKIGERQELKDYKGSKFDRGHLVPANDMTRSEKIMSESFLLSNMTPQIIPFNRGIWKQLEADARKWAKKKRSVHIITGPLYLDTNGVKTSNFLTLGQDNIAIPTHFYKIIVADSPPNTKLDAIAFIIPNDAFPTARIPSFITTIDEIEKDSGVNFLSRLDDSIENPLEAKRSDLW
jgi:endonuclease G